MPTPTIALDFQPSPDSNDVGGYEMFVDITGATDIQLLVPAGYSIPVNGLRMFKLVDDNGTVYPSQDKKDAVASLSGKNPDYSTVFNGEALPDGFTFTPTTAGAPAMLKDSDTNEGEYDYLVHIVTPEGKDTFADPGIRNH
jgi:hypothetical protein